MPFLAVWPRAGRIVIATAVAGWALSTLAPLPASAREPAVYTAIVKGVAVGGYDPVAYFTDGKPVAGTTEFTLEHGGAVWRFASAANRDAFKADPAKYAPQYGGYCAWAVSQLYLNYNKAVKLGWELAPATNIKKADGHWPTVLDKPVK
jgi:YHS domain-containing protein